MAELSIEKDRLPHFGRIYGVSVLGSTMIDRAPKYAATSFVGTNKSIGATRESSPMSQAARNLNPSLYLVCSPKSKLKYSNSMDSLVPPFFTRSRWCSQGMNHY